MGVQSYTEIQLRSFLFPHPKQPTSNMKAFVAMFAAVAAAAAEPWGYGLYGHPLVLGKSAPCVNAVLPAVHHVAPAVYHLPTVHTVAEPCVNVNGEAVPCAAGHPEYR